MRLLRFILLFLLVAPCHGQPFKMIYKQRVVTNVYVPRNYIDPGPTNGLWGWWVGSDTAIGPVNSWTSRIGGWVWETKSTVVPTNSDGLSVSFGLDGTNCFFTNRNAFIIPVGSAATASGLYWVTSIPAIGGTMRLFSTAAAGSIYYSPTSTLSIQGTPTTASTSVPVNTTYENAWIAAGNYDWYTNYQNWYTRVGAFDYNINSSSWSLGSAWTGANQFTGRVYEIRVYTNQFLVYLWRTNYGALVHDYATNTYKFSP